MNDRKPIRHLAIPAGLIFDILYSMNIFLRMKRILFYTFTASPKQNLMSKQKIVTSLILLVSLNLVAQDTTYIKTLVSSMYPGDSLFIGTACHEWALGTPTETILDNEFSYVTPANDFKQSYIHPSPGVWRWDRSDTWVNHCIDNNQVMRLHAPISPQVSPWAKDDSRTPEELETMLVEYISGLGQRYNDSSNIIWLDVVNEILNSDGTWFGPKPGTDSWENPWPIMGYDESVALRPPIYIKRAFEVATEYCSNFKFIINQHTYSQESWDKLKQTVQYLRDNGLRVDGIGWQAHVWAGWENEADNMERLGAFIDWCHTNNLEFHITEFNSWINEPFEEHWNEQANTFYAITKLASTKAKSGIVGINLWHIRGEETANKNRDGCPWAIDYAPKKSYYDIKKAIFDAALELGPSITSVPGRSAIAGEAYQYRITVAGAIGTTNYSFTTEEENDWLQMDASGLLSGTPQTPDTLHITVTVTDDCGPKDQEYTLITYDEPLVFTSSPVDEISKGNLYTYQVTHSGEAGYSLMTQPQAEWLDIDASGLISGIPADTGTFEVKVILTRNDVTVVQTFILTVSEQLEITSDPKTKATEGILYRYFVIYKGGGTFSLETEPPAPWLSIDQEGVVSGVPPGPGSLHVTITAENNETTITQEYDLEIAPALKITSDPVDTAHVGEFYSYQVVYQGEGEFTHTTDKAAEWLSISQDGLLSGTPPTRDTINVKIKMKNPEETYYQVFNLFILAPLETRSHSAPRPAIYPNPASEKITIANIEPGSDIIIFNSGGIEIYRAYNPSGTATIPVSGFEKGLYIVKAPGWSVPLVIR